MAHENSISEELQISIINYLSGKWDECNSQLLTTWVEESPENSKLFEQLVNLWESEKIARQEDAFNLDSAWSKLELKMSKKPSFSNRIPIFRQIVRYAAVFILALVLGGLGYSWLQKQTQSSFSSSRLVEYTAPYGSKTNLKLLDGSTVWLNAGTTLKYNEGFGSQNRDLQLSGEAYFEVVKNKELPFVVNAKEISVTALGTKFNVKAYPEEQNIETILMEGSVRLKDKGFLNKKGALLKPNQKAVFSESGKDFTISVISDASEVSWTTEEWVIRNTKLDEFAKLLERRYDIDFEFDDEWIKNYEFGGTIKGETVEQVLTALTLTSPLKYTIINKHVTLSIEESKIDQYKNILK